MVEPVKSPMQNRRTQSAVIPFALGVFTLLRGIARIGDDHPVSGWIMLVSGVVLVITAIALWRSRARASA